MIRALCLAVALPLLSIAAVPPDVDAVAFARAFRAGSADQFRNQRVRGTGMNFHGTVTERIADGTTRPSLVLTLGAAGETGPPALIRTWNEFVDAERARTTLVVALSGADLPALPGGSPQSVDFTGIFDGQVRTIMRVPAASDSRIADTGPCKGEEPRAAGSSFYCAPLLVNATATAAAPR